MVGVFDVFGGGRAGREDVRYVDARLGGGWVSSALSKGKEVLRGYPGREGEGAWSLIERGLLVLK